MNPKTQNPKLVIKKRVIKNYQFSTGDDFDTHQTSISISSSF
ncbi:MULTISPECIES: hypothetical protein [Chryseobacterium]|nr:MULTISPECIES: hypothetical protein [Chryseobacterium]MDR6923926.1 hypothetical protein [Chryseobacterium sp. 2987]